MWVFTEGMREEDRKKGSEGKKRVRGKEFEGKGASLVKWVLLDRNLIENVVQSLCGGLFRGPIGTSFTCIALY